MIVRRLRLCAPVLALTLSLGSAPPAHAQPAKISAAAAADARKKLGNGQKLLKAKKYAEAFAELEASYAADPQAPALSGMADAEEGQGHFAAALALHERVLAAHPKQVTAYQRKQLEKKLGELGLKVGALTLKVAQADALVEIDGKKIGSSPLSQPVRLDAGDHKVRITKVHHQPLEQVVAIVGGQPTTVELSMPLEVVTAPLIVRETEGKAVHVLIDGEDVGEAPWEGNLGPGSYKVSLVGEGLASDEKEIELRLGDKLEVPLEARQLLGHLVVKAPDGATIRLGGKKIGVGKAERDLPPGEYELEVRAPGFRKFESMFVIAANKTHVEEPQLTPIPVGPTAPKEDAYAGVYGRLATFGLAAPGGNGAKQPIECGATDLACNTSMPIGAGAALHVGYAFGLIGIEFAGSFAADYTKTTQKFTGEPPSTSVGVGPSGELTGAYTRDDTYEYTSYSGFGGGGLRLSSPGEVVRFTMGAAAGGAFRQTKLHRVSLGDTWEPVASGIVPAFAFDLGLLFGSTPGVKFLLGATARVELGPDLKIAAEGSTPGTDGVGRAVLIERGAQTLRSGTQIYVGPVLGLQFGR